MMLLYQLSRPLAYLWIKEKSGSKSVIDWYIPIILSSVLVFLYYILPVKTVIVGKDGLLTSMQGFLQIMPGFYLAALAAISTFNKVDLDYKLPTPSPTITIKEKGIDVVIELTRRRFLNYLFGYLTFISIALYIVIIFTNGIACNFALIPEIYLIGLRGGFIMFFLLFFFQMILVTTFGLYQLCERIHHSENVIDACSFAEKELDSNFDDDDF